VRMGGVDLQLSCFPLYKTSCLSFIIPFHRHLLRLALIYPRSYRCASALPLQAIRVWRFVLAIHSIEPSFPMPFLATIRVVPHAARPRDQSFQYALPWQAPFHRQ